MCSQSAGGALKTTMSRNGTNVRYTLEFRGTVSGVFSLRPAEPLLLLPPRLILS